jgi:hypothetical protein
MHALAFLRTHALALPLLIIANAGSRLVDQGDGRHSRFDPNQDRDHAVWLPASLHSTLAQTSFAVNV